MQRIGHTQMQFVPDWQNEETALISKGLQSSDCNGHSLSQQQVGVDDSERLLQLGD
jgi:hypothetical protein